MPKWKISNETFWVIFKQCEWTKIRIFGPLCHTQSFLKPLERENKFFLSSQVSLLVLKNEILCIQFFLSPHGVSLLLLSKLHKSFKVGKCSSRVLFLCTSFYQMLYSQLLYKSTRFAGKWVVHCFCLSVSLYCVSSFVLCANCIKKKLKNGSSSNYCRK